MTITFDETGLKIQSLAEIKTELQQDYRDEFGDGWNTADDSLSGKEIGIYAEREALIQEAIQAAYSANYRSTSNGVNLDYNLELTGLARQGATNSTVDVYVRGTPGQSIAAESLKVTVNDTGEIFQNTSAATNGSLPSESVTSITHTLGVATVTISGGHSFTNGSFVFIRGADQTEYNLLAEISGVTGTTFEYNVDSGAVSPATGTITAYQATAVAMEAQNTGPVVALAGTLINISGTVPGIVEAENADDATEGVNAETDAEARARADASINIAGGGFREAIITKLLNVSGVTAATVFSNVSNVTDSNGRPPGSVECFVTGGTDADVADAVYNSVSDGVQTFGTTTEIITDSQGQSVTIKFSRLASVRIYVDVELTKNTDISNGDLYPVDGDTQVAAALALIEFEPGQDVWESTLRNAITSAVPGIISIDVLEFDTVTPPVNTATIAIADTNFANIDSSDVNVTST